MKLSIATAIIFLTSTASTANAHLHHDDEPKKNRELTPQPYWGPSNNMVERSLASLEIRGDVARLEAENVTLHGLIATANAEIAALQGDVVRLDAEDVTLRGRINETDTAIAKANVEIAALRSDVVHLEAANATLHGQIATADTAIDTANAEITVLRSDVDRIENAGGNARLDIANDIATANNAITILASHLDEAKDIISALTARLQVLEATERKVFVTSEKYTGGEIDGIAGAFSKCQTLADDAGLSGTFFPWLSSSTYWPAKDFDKSGGPFFNTKGGIVANDWQDLITAGGSGCGSGCFLNREIIDENRVGTRDEVWTGTDVNGMPAMPDGYSFCNDWTSNNRTSSAIIGKGDRSGQTWTDYGFGERCDTRLRIYCFEQ